MAGLATRTEAAKNASYRVRLEVLSGKGGFPVCFKPDGGRFEVSANTLKLCNGTPYSLRLSFEPKLTVKSVSLLAHEDADPTILSATQPVTAASTAHHPPAQPTQQSQPSHQSQPLQPPQPLEPPHPAHPATSPPPPPPPAVEVADLLGLGDDFSEPPAAVAAPVASALEPATGAPADGPAGVESSSSTAGEAEAIAAGACATSGAQGAAASPEESAAGAAAGATAGATEPAAGPVQEHTVTWKCDLPASKKSERDVLQLHVITEEVGTIRLRLQVKVYKQDDKKCLNGEKLRFVQFNTLPDSQLDGYLPVTCAFFSMP